MKCHYCGNEIDKNDKKPYFREFMPINIPEYKEYWYHERCMIIVMLARAQTRIS